MSGTLSLKLRDLNENLVCALCGGYYIDATTIIECLHSFCRSCIVTHLRTNRCCPKCEIPAHKTRPLLNIRSDKTLQDVVFKLVPGLFEKERGRKRKFHVENGLPMETEEKKVASAVTALGKKENRVSLSLEHDNRDSPVGENSLWIKVNVPFPKRYLRCLSAVTISTINKLVRKKLAREDLEVICFCRGEVLPETCTLLEVANTFSWKSERPISLTYMTFAPKNRKRKILENIENEETAKKMAKETNGVAKPVAVLVASSQSNENTVGGVSKDPVAPQPFCRHTESKPRPISSVSNVKAILPKPRPPAAQATKPQGGSQNGGKSMSYSVMNVPLLEAVGAPVAETARQTPAQPVLRSFAPAMQQKPVNGITQGFIPQQNQSGERTKRINSIANRLQIQRQMQTERSATDNAFQAGNIFTQTQSASNQSPAKGSSQTSWTPTNAPATKLRLGTPGFQNSRLDEAESLDRFRQAMRPGNSGAQNSSPNRGLNQAFSSPPARAPGKFIQLKHTREVPPNYNQATEQQRKMRLLQQARSKYQEIQPKLPQRGSLNHGPRGQKVSSREDLQLLSTTRQLASLRQQQKLLNEIAAAVAGRSRPHLSSTESLRAAVSSLSARLTSPRLSSPVQVPAKNSTIQPRAGMSLTTPRPRFSLLSPKTTSQNPVRTNGTAPRPAQKNGTTFNEIPRVPSNLSLNSLSNPRERNMEIYRNTIAKAKAQVRELNLKEKEFPSQRNLARVAAAPYAVNRPTLQRKIQPKVPPTRPLYSSPVPIAPKPASVPSPRPSPTINYRPPPTRPQKVLTPVGGPPRAPNRQPFLSPPPTSHARLPQATPAIPEQDQPLCLVVKK